MDKTALQIERRIRPRVRYRTGAAKRDRQDFSIDAQRSNRRAFREYIQKQAGHLAFQGRHHDFVPPLQDGITAYPFQAFQVHVHHDYQRIAVYMTICLREPVILGRVRSDSCGPLAA